MTTITKEMMRHAKGLVKRSWAQGDENVLGESPAGCCVATACVAAATAAFHPNADRDAVLLFKHANGIDAMMPIGDWNDAPGRTKAEVLDAFDKAIAAAAAQVPGALRPRDPNKPHKKREPRTPPTPKGA